MKKAQALDDPPVELDEFGFGELIDADVQGGLRDSAFGGVWVFQRPGNRSSSGRYGYVGSRVNTYLR